MNSSLAVLAVLVPLTAAVPGTDLPVPECAWPSQVAADASNVALPDTSARYWVMPYKAYPDRQIVINTLPDGTTDPGCRYDSQVALDDDGHYAFAIGTEAQRAAIEAVPGVTFVPFSLDQPTAQHLLVLRNMLAAPDFAEAIKNVPPTGDPVAAAAVMGDYYPGAEVCDLAVLAAGGC